jgi:hypothetical protein
MAPLMPFRTATVGDIREARGPSGIWITEAEREEE